MVEHSDYCEVGTSSALGEFVFRASNSSDINLVVANGAAFSAATNQESRVLLGKESGGTFISMGVISARPFDPTSGSGGILTFSTRGSETVTERMRIDSSGRMLVGTSSTAYSEAILTARGGATTNTGEFNIASKENNITSGTLFAAIRITNTNGGRGAEITATADANWTNGSSHPTRLMFATTDSAQTTPTERMRISSDGTVFITKTGYSLATVGIELQGTGIGYFTATTNQVIVANRLSSDGTVIGIYQDTVQEGTISVSGTTVSYNGAHLSRWSQLPSGAIRIEILRGTVLSNLDEMCEWIDAPKEAVLWQEGEELPEGVSVGDIKEPANPGGPQDNEQLNRMKVSEVEGDKNVSGVFQCWDDDDDTYTNDFYCSMTGDFIIRIADGTTVQRGDLLMSAGDGTAKPQDDDIIRSKTVAKVTSTNVTCTYEDGSYCVPCVLMAC